MSPSFVKLHYGRGRASNAFLYRIDVSEGCGAHFATNGDTATRTITLYTREHTMALRKWVVAASTTLFLVSGLALAHEKADQLGKVTFPTSCNPKVQALFETGVAMLHSYWFGEARKTFEAVLKDDPGCAIAYWGVALDYLGNTLAAAPSAKNAQGGLEALEKGRSIGAKTERERDWIEALSAYFRDHDKVPVNARL